MNGPSLTKLVNYVFSRISEAIRHYKSNQFFKILKIITLRTKKTVLYNFNGHFFLAFFSLLKVLFIFFNKWNYQIIEFFFHIHQIHVNIF